MKANVCATFLEKKIKIRTTWIQLNVYLSNEYDFYG